MAAQTKQFQTTNEYRPALLCLLQKLPPMRAEDVIRRFGEEYKEQIPTDHYESNDSGKIKWDWAVRWSRQDLYDAGFVDSPQKGIWVINEAGRHWLSEHPDGGGAVLLAYIRNHRPKKEQRQPRPRKTKASPAVPSAPRRGRPPKTAAITAGDQDAHHLLDGYIAQIRQFLAGRATSRPSDEQICDWVQFCYQFELFTEGAELFQLIDATATNPWQYARAKKYAQICRLRQG